MSWITFQNDRYNPDFNRVGQDWQERNKKPYQRPESLDAEKPSEGNADV